MAKAQKDSDGEDESKSSGSSSSDESACEIQSDTEGAGKKKKKKQAENEEREAAQAREREEKEKKEKEKERERGAEPKRRKLEKNTPSDRFENQLAEKRKVLQALTELTPEAIWRSLVRATELDRRLGRAGTSQTDLDKILASSHASAQQKNAALTLKEDIEKASASAGAMKEVAKMSRSKSHQEIANVICCGVRSEFYQQLEACAPFLFQDAPTVMDMVQVIAKKLLDAEGKDVPCQRSSTGQHADRSCGVK